MVGHQRAHRVVVARVLVNGLQVERQCFVVKLYGTIETGRVDPLAEQRGARRGVGAAQVAGERVVFRSLRMQLLEQRNAALGVFACAGRIVGVIEIHGVDQVRARQAAQRDGILAFCERLGDLDTARGRQRPAPGIAGDHQGAAHVDQVRSQQAFGRGIARVSGQQPLDEIDGTVVTRDGFGRASHVGGESLPLDGGHFRICLGQVQLQAPDRRPPRGPAC